MPQLERQVDRAVRSLTCYPQVRRIWLFGSAAKRDHFDSRSDLDFAVEGLPSSELPGAWAELDRTLDREVDLVRLEETHATLRDLIVTTGRVVYER